MPIRFKLTAAKLFIMIAGNTVIALFITIVHQDARFPVSFLFSQSIGLCTGACVIVAVNYVKASTLRLQTGIIIAAIVAGVAIGATAGRFMIASLLDESSARQLEKYNFQTFTLGYALLFGFTVSYIFISLQRLSDEKIKRLEVEKNAAITEIKLLQSQMEPHFLFNTLSNILELIDSKPEKAKQMLEAFTSFLRSSLITARSERITIGQEMDVVKNYLGIFTLRMGDRLRYELQVPDALRAFPVPPLLIQPLVENSIKHGLEPSVPGGVLQVSVSRQGDRIRITVADSGVGINEKSGGNGIGVENIKKRLSLIYGGRAGLFFEENRPSGVRAIIELPYETGTSDHSGR